MDKLANDVHQAIQANLSYGKWKAMQPVVTKTEKAPLPAGWQECECCGKPFKKVRAAQRFCELSCRERAYANTAREMRKGYNKKWREAQKEKKHED